MILSPRSSSSSYRTFFDLFHQSRRSFTQPRQLDDLQRLYQLLKEESLSKRKTIFLEPDRSGAVFSFEECSFSIDESQWHLCQQWTRSAKGQSLRIRFRFVCSVCPPGAWRVDLDYTLARYKPTLHSLIYDIAKTNLVKNFRVSVSSIIVIVEMFFSIVRTVSRCDHEFLLSTRHGCTRPSFRYQTRLADESR